MLRHGVRCRGRLRRQGAWLLAGASLALVAAALEDGASGAPHPALMRSELLRSVAAAVGLALPEGGPLADHAAEGQAKPDLAVEEDADEEDEDLEDVEVPEEGTGSLLEAAAASTSAVDAELDLDNDDMKACDDPTLPPGVDLKEHLYGDLRFSEGCPVWSVRKLSKLLRAGKGDPHRTAQRLRRFVAAGLGQKHPLAPVPHWVSMYELREMKDLNDIPELIKVLVDVGRVESRDRNDPGEAPFWDFVDQYYPLNGSATGLSFVEEEAWDVGEEKTEVWRLSRQDRARFKSILAEVDLDLEGSFKRGFFGNETEEELQNRTDEEYDRVTEEMDREMNREADEREEARIGDNPEELRFAKLLHDDPHAAFMSFLEREAVNHGAPEQDSRGSSHPFHRLFEHRHADDLRNATLGTVGQLKGVLASMRDGTWFGVPLGPQAQEAANRLGVNRSAVMATSVGALEQHRSAVGIFKIILDFVKLFIAILDFIMCSLTMPYKFQIFGIIGNIVPVLFNPHELFKMFNRVYIQPVFMKVQKVMKSSKKLSAAIQKMGLKKLATFNGMEFVVQSIYNLFREFVRGPDLAPLDCLERLFIRAVFTVLKPAIILISVLFLKIIQLVWKMFEFIIFKFLPMAATALMGVKGGGGKSLLESDLAMTAEDAYQLERRSLNPEDPLDDDDDSVECPRPDPETDKWMRSMKCYWIEGALYWCKARAWNATKMFKAHTEAMVWHGDRSLEIMDLLQPNYARDLPWVLKYAFVTWWGDLIMMIRVKHLEPIGAQACKLGETLFQELNHMILGVCGLIPYAGGLVCSLFMMILKLIQNKLLEILASMLIGLVVKILNYIGNQIGVIVRALVVGLFTVVGGTASAAAKKAKAGLASAKAKGGKMKKVAGVLEMLVKFAIKPATFHVDKCYIKSKKLLATFGQVYEMKNAMGNAPAKCANGDSC